MQAATTTITVTSPTTAKLIANLGNPSLLNRLRPLAAGTATIAGSFGGGPATGLSMTIGAPAAAVTVTSVALSVSWCSSGSTDVQCSGTFAGIPGSTSVLEVGVQCGSDVKELPAIGPGGTVPVLVQLIPECSYTFAWSHAVQ